MGEAPTVANLIRKLQRLPQNDIVVLASDSAGNKFSVVDMFIGKGFYLPESVEHYEVGAVVDYDISEEEIEYDGYGDRDRVTAIILWPVT